MSYNIALACGCLVYVSTHPSSGLAHTRIIETRGRACAMRQHDVGVRLGVWEMTPAPPQDSGANGYPCVMPPSANGHPALLP